MAIGARKQPLYDQLVDILTEKIDHEYRAGDMIPSERELSERYGLSRTTVRLACLLYTSPSPRDKRQSRMPSSA